VDLQAGFADGLHAGSSNGDVTSILAGATSEPGHRRPFAHSAAEARARYFLGVVQLRVRPGWAHQVPGS
jgi:hypothetical protein